MQKTNTPVTRILDLVSSESRFTKFNEAINAAGLTERFLSPNRLTVFAPTNEAFDKLPQEKAVDLLKPENRDYLKRVLLLHVVPGALMVEDLKKADALKTEAGRTLKVTVSQDLKEINLGDSAKVILPKVEAGNGIVYPLDTVLWPTAAAATA